VTRKIGSTAGMRVSTHQHDSCPKRTKFPQPNVKIKDGKFSAFHNIFGLSFEMSKQLIKWENEKDIGKTTVDSWRHEPRLSKWNFNH